MPRRIRSIIEKTPSHRTHDLRVAINILTKHVINLRASIHNMIEKKRLIDFSRIQPERLKQTINAQFISHSSVVSQKTALVGDYSRICSDHIHICSLADYEFEKTPIDLFDLPETVSIEIDDREGGFLYHCDLAMD